MKDHNPHLDEFLRFYSQSDTSTGGTRGYDPKTYVDTKLDEKLTPAIFDQKTKLVILSGNAGDGKTAYIQRVEAQAKTNGATVTGQNDNGTAFTPVLAHLGMQKILVDSGQLGFQNFVQNGNLAQAKDIAAGLLRAPYR